MDNQNPFLEILQQNQGQNQQPGMGGGDMSGMMAAQQAMPQGEEGEEQGMQMLPPDPGLPGETGDSTKPLVQALQAVHNYIAASTDKTTISLARSVLTLLIRLIQQDQDRASQLDNQPRQPMMEEEEE